MAKLPNSTNAVHNLSGGRRQRTKRGFTLLELVVALVVLGILAALAVPTYATVIGNAKSSVATSNALSLAVDAVAIASGHDTVATDSQFTQAAGEDNGAVTVVPSTYTTGGGTSSITLASGNYDVVVSWPDSVNGAPYVTSIAVAATTTTLAGGGSLSCTITTSLLTGYSSGTDVSGPWSIVCTGVTGPQVAGVMAVTGGYLEFQVSDADMNYGSAPYAALPSTVSVTDTTTLASDDSVPSAYYSASIEFASTETFFAAVAAGASQADVSGSGAYSCPNSGTGCFPAIWTSRSSSLVTTDGSSAAGEPDCAFTVVGPLNPSGYVTGDWSLTCTGVTGFTLQISASVPASWSTGYPGIVFFDVFSADSLYGSGFPYAPIDSSFTVNQSTVNPTDDSSPSAPYANQPEFGYIGITGPQPASSVGQYVTATGDPDSCISAGTGCSVPTVTTSGF